MERENLIELFKHESTIVIAIEANNVHKLLPEMYRACEYYQLHHKAFPYSRLAFVEVELFGWERIYINRIPDDEIVNWYWYCWIPITEYCNQEKFPKPQTRK